MHRVRVLAAQEFVDLDAKALLREATDMHVARRRECQARLGAAIARKHGGASYVGVRAEQMVGVLLLVYVRRAHAAAVAHVHTENVKCGFGVGVGDTSVYKAGNKGGVAARGKKPSRLPSKHTTDAPTTFVAPREAALAALAALADLAALSRFAAGV